MINLRGCIIDEGARLLTMTLKLVRVKFSEVHQMGYWYPKAVFKIVNIPTIVISIEFFRKFFKWLDACRRLFEPKKLKISYGYLRPLILVQKNLFNYSSLTISVAVQTFWVSLCLLLKLIPKTERLGCPNKLKTHWSWLGSVTKSENLSRTSTSLSLVKLFSRPTRNNLKGKNHRKIIKNLFKQGIVKNAHFLQSQCIYASN